MISSLQCGNELEVRIKNKHLLNKKLLLDPKQLEAIKIENSSSDIDSHGFK
jgi:hypothetical protein